MTLNDVYARVDRYLRSDDTRPRIVNFQELNALNDFKVRFSNAAVLKSPLDYSAPDEDLRLEEVYADLRNLRGVLMLHGITSQLKLLDGGILSAFLQNVAGMSFANGKLILLCYQCDVQLRFSDMRLRQLVYCIDGTHDSLPKLQFIPLDMELPGSTDAVQGVDKIGVEIEAAAKPLIVIRTRKQAKLYMYSAYSISEYADAYDALCHIDGATLQLDRRYGTSAQWRDALNALSKAGSWSSLISRKYGGTAVLELAALKWTSESSTDKWLYFIALKLFGAPNSIYMDRVARSVQSVSDVVRSMYRLILDEDWRSPDFLRLYADRKQLLSKMFADPDEAEITDYICKTSIRGKDSIRYLTDNTRQERESIIEQICKNASEYTRSELHDVLKTVYPDLAAYLDAYSFIGNEWLDVYFEEYRYSKVLNAISPELQRMADEQASQRDFLKLPTRMGKFDAISKQNTHLFFVDAMGIEFIPYIVHKCAEYGLNLTVEICHSELPSLTNCNKDFWNSFDEKHRRKVSGLDEIKHKGKENYDYQTTKTPVYMTRELEIVDEVLKRARAGLLIGKFSKALLVADHGATRMAVINENVIDIDVNSRGTNCGRVCEYTDAITPINNAIREGDLYILADYHRFKGCHPASVEAHGGATLEETLIPIIELSLRDENVEISVVEAKRNLKTKTLDLVLHSKTLMRNAEIKVGDNAPCPADASSDGHKLVFKLPSLHLQWGEAYSATLYSDGKLIQSDIKFSVVSRAGTSKHKGGIL